MFCSQLADCTAAAVVLHTACSISSSLRIAALLEGVGRMLAHMLLVCYMQGSRWLVRSASANAWHLLITSRAIWCDQTLSCRSTRSLDPRKVGSSLLIFCERCQHVEVRERWPQRCCKVQVSTARLSEQELAQARFARCPHYQVYRRAILRGGTSGGRQS